MKTFSHLCIVGLTAVTGLMLVTACQQPTSSSSTATNTTTTTPAFVGTWTGGQYVYTDTTGVTTSYLETLTLTSTSYEAVSNPTNSGPSTGTTAVTRAKGTLTYNGQTMTATETLQDTGTGTYVPYTGSSATASVTWAVSGTKLTLLGTNGVGTFFSTANTYGSIQGGIQTDGTGNFYGTGSVGTSSTALIPVYWYSPTSKSGSTSSWTGQMYTLPLGSGQAYGKATLSTLDSTSSPSNFYIAGQAGSSNSATIPEFWVVTTSNLYSGTATETAVPLGTYSVGDVNALYSKSGTLYLAGDVGNSSSTLVPAYWTYTAGGFTGPTLLSGGYAYGMVQGLQVDSTGNVYFVGAGGTSSTAIVPVYWVLSSGTLSSPTMLGSATYGQARGIRVTSSAVYVTGYAGTSSTSADPTYWSFPLGGGTITTVTLDATSGKVNGGLKQPTTASDYFLAGSLTSGGPAYWDVMTSGFVPVGNRHLFSSSVSTASSYSYQATAGGAQLDQLGDLIIPVNLGSSSTAVTPFCWTVPNSYLTSGTAGTGALVPFPIN